MRVCVTERRDLSPPDLRPAAELATSLALPKVATLRDGILIGEIALILLARFLFRIELPFGWIAIPVAVTAASNFLLHRFMGAFSTRHALGSLLALDTICLTALLALSGGPANPFSILYLVQITLSAVVLSKRWTWTLGVLSIIGFGSLFWVHVHVPLFEGHHATGGSSVHLAGMWVAFAVGALLITVLIGTVSEALRRREQEVLQFRERIAHHERIASIATLAAGAAHELGTPLATIAVASRELELYGEKVIKDAGVSDDARLIRSEVERCSQILRQMSGQGGEPAGEIPAPIRLKEILERVKDGLTSAEAELIRTHVAEDVTALVPPGATRQALTVLVKNALEASADGRPVALSAECAAEKIRFTVRDSGCGMEMETLRRLSEPFFTTKGPGRGIGLGTFLVRLFAERLNGDLIFESEAGSGTTAILELPLIRHDGKG